MGIIEKNEVGDSQLILFKRGGFIQYKSTRAQELLVNFYTRNRINLKIKPDTVGSFPLHGYM